MISANTNLQAIRLQNCLNSNSNAVLQALERMSTGFRINRAADDAAGYFVATNLNTQIRGLKIANTNIENGNSLLNIAEGSLSQMNDILLRIRELSLQSANGVYSAKEREAMQLEVDNLLEEITRIKNSTEYNGKNLFGTQTKLEKDKTYTDTVATSAISNSYSPAISTDSTVPLASSINLVRNYALRAASSEEDPIPIETGNITLAYGQLQKISFGTKVYTFQGNSGSDLTISYSYNHNSGELTLSGNAGFLVTSAENQDNNIILNSSSIYYYANTENNNIVVNGNNCYIYGKKGDDNITINGNSNLVRGDDGNDTITILNGTNNRIYSEQGDDSIYIKGGSSNAIYTGSGSNYVEVSSNRNYIQGETGTNRFVVNEGANNNIFDGKNSTSSIIDNGTNTGKMNIDDTADWMPTSGLIGCRGSQVQTITLFGKTYTIKYTETSSYFNRFLTYSYDNINDRLTFTGDYFEITSAENQTDNIIFNGAYSTVNLGDGDDTFVINSGTRNTINAGAGNDNITLNSGATVNSVYGEAGDDNIAINTNNNYIQDGEGSNNITIGSGKSGNIINEENSVTNTIDDKGTNTGIINSPNNEKPLPPSGTLSILSGQTMTLALAGKEYTINNKNISPNATLQYSINSSTGQITFNSSNAEIQISSKAGQENNLKLEGNRISYYGSELEDIIDLKASECYIYGGAGNDEITVGSTWNRVYGQDGDDRIILNSSSYSSTVDGGNGNDYIEINHNNNQNVRGGSGADEIIINGTSNKVYGGADSDTITINKEGNDVYGEAGNDTININTSNEGRVASGGAGNDSIYVNASNGGGISGGDGDDWFYVASGANNNIINGGSGTNTLEDHGSNTGYINIENKADKIGLSGTLILEPGQTISDILIGDKKYTIRNTSTSAQSLIYSYDQKTGVISFSGDYFNITTAAGQKDNIKISGNSNTVSTGDLDDEITIEKGVDNKIYGGNGNDTITMKSANNYLYGESGDDTITLNAQNTSTYTVDGGNDNDTIIINSNNNTNLKGGNGNDTFVNNGSNNTINGGAGTNTLNENGNSTTRENVSIVTATKFPSAVLFNAGETITMNINGRTYTVTNNNSSSSNFGYSLQNGVVNFNASNFEITSQNNQNDNIAISGSNNTINAVNGTNNITILSGSQNTINGGSDADTITMNSENNNIYGNGGNDNIILNKTNDATHFVDGGTERDTITVNSNNNLNITGGDGNDTLIVNGNGNSLKGGSGNDTFRNNGNTNTFVGESGYNTFMENGTNSTVQNINKVVLLNNKGSITIQAGVTMDYEIGGKTYTITNTEGNDKVMSYISSGSEITFIADNMNISAATNQMSNIKVQGNNNTISTGSQNDIVKISGDGNTVNTGAGNDAILIEGNNNSINGNDGNDTFTLTTGDANTINGGNGNDIFINNGTNSTYSNINEKQEIARPFNLQVGANGDESCRIEIELGFMIPFIDLNISSEENAISALNDIDELINSIQTKISQIGVYQNRLESIMKGNITKIENYTSAKSTIMDADIAEESAAYTKNMILQNITASLLSQANNLPSRTILQLVNG